jgi:hypothetical protein
MPMGSKARERGSTASRAPVLFQCWHFMAIGDLEEGLKRPRRRWSAARYLRMVHMGDILFWATVGVLVVIAVLLVLSF